MLGSHFAPVSYTLIPAENESSEAYKQAWRATKAAARRIMSLRLCDSEENDTVAACLAGRPYMIDKELPISYPLGDNSAVLTRPTSTTWSATSSSTNTFVVSCDAPLSTRVNDSKSCSYSFYEVWVRPVLLIGSLNGGADL